LKSSASETSRPIFESLSSPWTLRRAHCLLSLLFIRRHKAGFSLASTSIQKTNL